MEAEAPVKVGNRLGDLGLIIACFLALIAMLVLALVCAPLAFLYGKFFPGRPNPFDLFPPDSDFD